MYRMIDGKYSLENYKSSKTSIEAIIENPEMLRLVPYYLKTKKVRNHVVK